MTENLPCDFTVPLHLVLLEHICSIHITGEMHHDCIRIASKLHHSILMRLRCCAIVRGLQTIIYRKSSAPITLTVCHVIRHHQVKYGLLDDLNAFVNTLYNVVPPKADNCPAFIQESLVYLIVPFPVSGYLAYPERAVASPLEPWL